MHPTFRCLNQTSKLLFCERRLMVMALIVGPGIIWHSNVYLGLIAGLFLAFLAWKQGQDPIWIALKLGASNYRPHYDAGLRKPFVIKERP
jgi:hypothetical protein